MLEKILLMRLDLFITAKKRIKNIFGKASIQDVKELKEEGIETSTIPWIEDKEN